jgi:hypothetical protein
MRCMSAAGLRWRRKRRAASLYVALRGHLETTSPLMWRIWPCQTATSWRSLAAFAATSWWRKPPSAFSPPTVGGVAATSSRGRRRVCRLPCGGKHFAAPAVAATPRHLAAAKYRRQRYCCCCPAQQQYAVPGPRHFVSWRHELCSCRPGTAGAAGSPSTATLSTHTVTYGNYRPYWAVCVWSVAVEWAGLIPARHVLSADADSWTCGSNCPH